MKDNIKKIMILIMSIVIVILAIVILVLIVNNKNKENSKDIYAGLDKEAIRIEAIDEVLYGKEENTKLNADGSKDNISNKIKETKKIGNIEVSNMTIGVKNRKTSMEATLKNVGNNEEGGFLVKLVFVDKSGKEKEEATGFVNTIGAGEESKLVILTEDDIADIYDYTIEKK